MASSIPNPISLLQLQSVSSQTRICYAKCGVDDTNRTVMRMFWSGSCRLRLICQRRWKRDLLRARAESSLNSAKAESGDGNSKNVGGDDDGVVVGVAKERGGGGAALLERTVSRMHGAVSSVPPFISVMKRNISSKFTIGLFIAFLVIVVRQIIIRKPSRSQHGSVADLVKRGQLRSDRRGISRPLKYEDPFNNPLVKVGKSNLTIEMCGKVYRLAPVTLTEEQQSIHQKRRSRAYKWKRPTIFLKEGDAMPPDVDPDTVRWIPANHPFATTVSDIDEEFAQNNVYQKNGVPSRIKAEHEALQKKLEALQSEQKLNKAAIDPNSAGDFERPFKSFPGAHEQPELNLSVEQPSVQGTNPKSGGQTLDSSDNNASEQLKKP